MAKVRRRNGWNATGNKAPQNETLSQGSPQPISPAPAPAPVPAPVGSVAQAQPMDPLQSQQHAQNLYSLGNTLTNDTYERGQVSHDYGLTAAGGIDPSNPFSQAALYERAYKQSQRGVVNSAAGQGQLYSGSTQRGLDEGTFKYQRDFSQLRSAADKQYNAISQREAQAQLDYSQGNIDADSDALDRALAQDAADPAPTEAQQRGAIGPDGKINVAVFASEWAKDLKKLRRRQIRNPRNRR